MDRAVALPTSSVEPPKPYTISTAREAGWTWRIPLQHRVGNGHVYSSRFMESDRALQILLDAVDGEPLSDPRHLRFVTGRRKKFWNANCVAIGLSAGFLEPLESTSIHLIQSGVSKLLALFPNQAFNPTERDEYNRLLSVSYQHTRDFILLHYIATERTDTPFWQYVQSLEVPETLAHKMALLESSGSFFRYEDELFSVVSWLAVMHGQRRGPKGYNPVADSLSVSNLSQSLANMRGLIGKTVNAMPTHQQFIDRYCGIKQNASVESA
jgi:tryptophan halogenase